MPPHAPVEAAWSKPHCSGGPSSLVVMALATWALGVMEVVAGGIRVSGGPGKVSCISAKSGAPDLSCPAPANAQPTSKPHLGGGSAMSLTSTHTTHTHRRVTASRSARPAVLAKSPAYLRSLVALI